MKWLRAGHLLIVQEDGLKFISKQTGSDFNKMKLAKRQETRHQLQ